MAKILLSTLQLPAGPIGPQGPVGPQGDPGLDGANVLPTSEAVAQAVTEEGPAKDALSATIGSRLRELNVRDFGAIGDGNNARAAANTVAINTAIQTCSAAGGGIVRVPIGDFRTNNNIKVLDGVTLLGDGYGSHIHNIAVTGFARCTVVTGNVGDMSTGATSLFNETKYNLQAATRGKVVTLVNSADIATGGFVVGDIVGIAGFDVWALPAPDNHEKQINLNEIEAISGGNITLRYPLPDNYPVTGGNPTIRRVSGSLMGYNGQPGYMTKNCGVSNIRLTQVTGLSSGWYALFACGVNQHFQDIWTDNCSGMFGSNGLSHSSLKNVQGLYESRFLDVCDWITSVEIDNVKAAKFAVNPALPILGLSINNGTDVKVSNVTVDLGGYGGATFYLLRRGMFENVTILNTGSDDGMTLGLGGDCEAINCKIINPHKNGIVLAGDRHSVNGCAVPTVGPGGYSVLALTAADTYFVHDNAFGVAGSETSADRFYQATPSLNGQVYNNTGYVEKVARQGRVNWAGNAQTQATSYAVLKTTTLKGTSGILRGFRVTAAGQRSGIAGTKDIKLALGGTTIASVSYGASDNQTWELSATISVRPDTNAVNVQGRGQRGTTLTYSQFQAISNGLVSDAALTVEAQVANAADTVFCNLFVVEPIMELLR